MLINSPNISGSLFINGVGFNSGSFSGSFVGDGSGLINVGDTSNLNTTLTDFEDIDIYYYGGITNSGGWQINKWDNITANKTIANINNNPTITTLSDAWSIRLTLNYS
jgi:hypothetical protein